MEQAGALGWSPDVFWKATFAELFWFMRGFQIKNGIDPDDKSFATREDLNELLELDRKLNEGK